MNLPLDPAQVQTRLGLIDVHDAHGTLCGTVEADRWHGVLAQARAECGLTYFDWLSAVDESTDQAGAVDIVAHIVRPNPTPAGLPRMLLRARLTTALVIASVTDLWPGAAWHERETHEMFGVDFAGFSDGTGHGLRPLLLPDGFVGTPLRKSFQLTARASKPWPGAKEPGETEGGGSPSRRKILPPGVPPADWGPRAAESADD